MDEEKVDDVQAERHARFLKRAKRLLVTVVTIAQLRRNECLASLACRRKRSPDLPLIEVRLRGVNVAIPKRQRILNGLLSLERPNLERAKAHEGNLYPLAYRFRSNILAKDLVH